jgi:uncharacterized protein YraI
MRTLAAALILAATLAPLPAGAAPLTARASGVQAVHLGAGSYFPIIDKLRKNERVRLDFCTREQKWCHVIQLDGGPDGWVLGSYLIGSAAKNAVTPYDFGFDPLDPTDLFPHH